MSVRRPPRPRVSMLSRSLDSDLARFSTSRSSPVPRPKTGSLKAP